MYRCRGCGLEVWKSTPASPIFLFALGSVGLTFMIPLCLNQGWNLSWQLYGIGFVLFAGLGLGLTCLVDSAFNQLTPRFPTCVLLAKRNLRFQGAVSAAVFSLDSGSRGFCNLLCGSFWRQGLVGERLLMRKGIPLPDSARFRVRGAAEAYTFVTETQPKSGPVGHPQICRIIEPASPKVTCKEF